MKQKAYFLLCLCCWLVLGAQAQQSCFRFAHLTDLHISPNNAQPTEDLLRSVAQLNATDGLDFVIVTGDLTEEGDRASLEKVKSCLDLLKMPHYTVLGNHETKWSESGCTAFAEIFGAERFKLEHKGFLFLGFNSTHYPMMEGDVDNWYQVTDAVRPYNVRLFIGGHYHRDRELRYDGIPGVLVRSNLRDREGKPGYGIYEVTEDSIRVYTQRIGEQPVRWAGFSLEKEYYDPQGKAEKYPDFSVNQTYDKVKKEWLIQTGVGIYCSPAVGHGQVFVGDDLGQLTAYRMKDGKKAWTFHTGKRIVGGPAVKDETVVVGSADGHIYGLNAATGELRWKVTAAGPVLGAITIDGDKAYVGASDGTFRAIQIQTGEVVWSYTGVKGYVECQPLIDGDNVVFGAWDNTLYALNKHTGKEVWKWTGGLTRMHFSPAAVWPVAAHRKIFIADPKRALTAINRETGETVWRTYQSQVRESIGISEDRERIYAKTMNDSIVCYSAVEDKPKQVWATSVGFGYEHAPSMLMEKEQTVYGSTKEGLLFALDARSGALLWKHKVGNSLINTVCPLGKNKVLFTATSGEVGILKVRK